MIERDAVLGGNHTWSFHGTDVIAGSAYGGWTLIEASWSGYEIHFSASASALARQLSTIVSERLDGQLRERLGDAS